MTKLERIDFCIEIDYLLLQGDIVSVYVDSVRKQIDELLRERFKLMLLRKYS